MNEFLLGIPGKLTNVITSLSTLLSRVTGNVDVNVSSRAPAATAMSNAVWTDALATKLGNGRLNASPSAPLTWGQGITTNIGYQVVAPTLNTNLAVTNSTTMVDVVNITGSGYLTALYLQSNAYDGGVVELVIDGVVIASKTVSSNYMVCVVGWFDVVYRWDGGSTITVYRCMEGSPVYFNTSLVIRHRKTSSTHSSNQELYYRYVKT